MAKKKTTRKKTTKKTTRRTTARKTTAKKKTTRKTTRKAATKKTAKKTPTIRGSAEPRTKSQIFNTIAEATDMNRKEITSVLGALESMIVPKSFQIPLFLNISSVGVPESTECLPLSFQIPSRIIPNSFKFVPKSL